MAVEVTLREVVDADLPYFFAHQADPSSSWMAGVPARDRDQFSQQWASIRVDPSTVVRTIEADGVVAGNVLSFIRDGRREVGYRVDAAHWGRGIASRALVLFLAELTERPVFAVVAKDNQASLRVVRKAGFTDVAEETEDNAVRGEMTIFVILRLDT